ncbi:MAG TPA: hypothetical protein VLC08_16375 [Chitinolyticbacter sp.]|nr:hypothetical protein [Chitinolyticbacter sp.]
MGKLLGLLLFLLVGCGVKFGLTLVYEHNMQPEHIEAAGVAASAAVGAISARRASEAEEQKFHRR